MSLASELIVDSFAGGGGASEGIRMATGRDPDFAINHDADAMAMHAVNHPATVHLSKNIWQVDPIEVVGHRPVGLLWASPDCKHFSKAKGGRPAQRNIRDLAWVVVVWARRVRPRVIILENVEEFRGWGPLQADGRPCPARQGETFGRWVGELRRLGYRVEHRELRACDYGAPTIRKRLFVIARRDGLPIAWPEPTHGAPGSAEVAAGLRAPWRTAAEVIDWSLPCPSIFLTREEGRAIGVNRPLAEATMARIARGVRKYVLEAARPFIVPITHTGDVRVEGLDEPLRTTTCAHRGERAPVMPFVSRQFGASVGSDVGAPVGTTTAGGGGKSVLVAAHLTKFRTNSTGSGVDEPLHTVTAGSYVKRPGGAAPLGLVAATMVQMGYGERSGQAPRVPGLDKPLGTVVAGGCKHALVAAFLAQHNGGMVGHDAREPVSTIVQKGCTQALVAAHMLNLKGGDRRARDATEPLGAVCAGGWHHAQVAAFLSPYYGTDQAPELDAPAPTATTRDRFGLVTVTIDGEPYVIADIGMRMLSPRELFRAQGFAEFYVIDRRPDGSALTKTAQIRMCGNSVCPPLAAALVRANFAAAAAPTVEAAA